MKVTDIPGCDDREPVDEVRPVEAEGDVRPSRRHYALSVFMARHEMVMFLGGLVLNLVIVFGMVIYGLGVMDCSGSGHMDALRLFMLVDGIINALFYIYAMAMICEPEYCTYTYEERVERYGKYLAPVIVLFPLFAPHAVAVGLSLLVYIMIKVAGWAYQKLESKLLG